MKIKQTLLISVFIMVLVGVFVPNVAATTSCGGVETTIISCSQNGSGSGTCPDGTVITPAQIKNNIKCPDGSAPDTVSNTGAWGILLVIINILTAGVGVAAVGGILAASIMYMTAGGSVEQTKKANIYLSNTLLGVIVFAAMFAFLNYIIPGGLFAP